MNTVEPDLEQQVRQLAGVGLSTRRIAQALGGSVSQSTVVRTIKRINSGPQPILQEKGTSRPFPVTLEMVRVGALVLLVITLMVLTAAVATIAWR